MLGPTNSQTHIASDHTPMYVHTNTHTHTHVRTHVKHTHIHTHIHIHTHTRETRTHVGTERWFSVHCMCHVHSGHNHTYTHNHTHIHTHIHIQTCAHTYETHTRRYGEMVVSALYESPPNRQQVATSVLDDNTEGRTRVQQAVKEELAAGALMRLGRQIESRRQCCRL
jgi:hypothetical protein